MLRKLFWIATVSILILPTLCFSDIIDGPANIRSSPNGKIIMSIDDRTSVAVMKREGDWYYLHLNIDVDKKNVDGNTVARGAEVRWLHGKVFGKSVNPFQLTLFRYENRAGIVSGELKAVIHKSSIRTASVKNHKLISSLITGYYLLSNFVDLKNKTYSKAGGYASHPIFGEFEVKNIEGEKDKVNFFGGNFHEGLIGFNIDLNGMFEGSTCFKRFCIRSIKIISERSFSLDVNGVIQTFYSIDGLKKVQ